MLPMTWASAGKMRTLPGVPSAIRGLPFLKTIVGAMLATERLPGPMELGWPGKRSMSEMSSLSSTPYPCAITPLPKKWPIVWLAETTVPSESTTQ